MQIRSEQIIAERDEMATILASMLAAHRHCECAICTRAREAVDALTGRPLDDDGQGEARIEGTREELADLLVTIARALREWGPWPVGGRGGTVTVEAVDGPGSERADRARDVARDVVRLLG